MKSIVSLFLFCANFACQPSKLAVAMPPKCVPGAVTMAVVPSGADCQYGGLALTSGDCDPQFVCNGATGSTGATGPTGQTGATGENGLSIVAATLPAPSNVCPNGGTVVMMASDTMGTGVYSTEDAHQESITICNGLNGEDAHTLPYTVLGTIEPCGANSSPWKEVLLCMANGNILADFSATMSGEQTRLVFIPAGHYEDTDSSGCAFDVTSNSSGFTVSWNAGSNEYASWLAGSQDCSSPLP